MSAQLQNQSNVDVTTNNIQAQSSVQTIKEGFKNPVYDSQSVFRKVLKSMSEPGVISIINAQLDDKPEPLFSSTYAIALTFFDHDTSIALSNSINNGAVLSTLRFHCSSPVLSDSQTVDFILCDESEIPDLGSLKLGTETYPDQSCTVIIETQNIEKREGCTSSSLDTYALTGAGIEDKHLVSCSAFTASLIKQRESLQKLFPQGVDLIFTHEDKFFCLPRTTLITKEVSSCM